jgi:hypothetical protein
MDKRQESTSFLKKRSKKLLSVWASAFPDGFGPDACRTITPVLRARMQHRGWAGATMTKNCRACASNFDSAT